MKKEKEKTKTHKLNRMIGVKEEDGIKIISPIMPWVPWNYRRLIRQARFKNEQSGPIKP